MKITGIGVDAALAGVTAEDPALADTLGRVLPILPEVKLRQRIEREMQADTYRTSP